ncbi:MAG: HAD family hydrolase [bacterium]
MSDSIAQDSDFIKKVEQIRAEKALERESNRRQNLIQDFQQNPKDTVLFDLDQTLCDTEALLNQVFQEDYRKYLKDKLPDYDSNIQGVDAIVLEYLNNPDNKGTKLEKKFELINAVIEQELNFRFPENPIQELNALHFQNNLECIPRLVKTGEIKVFPGIVNLLDSITAKGQRIGIYSNRDTQSTLLILESLGLINYFDLSLCPSEISFRSGQEFEQVVKFEKRKSKPDPHALSELYKILPDLKIVKYFGDGPADKDATLRYSQESGKDIIETVLFRHQKGLELTTEEKFEALKAQRDLGVPVYTSTQQYIEEQGVGGEIKKEVRKEIIRGNRMAFR